MQIYKDEQEAENRLLRLSKSKKELETAIKEKRVHSNEPDKPLYLYKNIMCPLKDKCPDATGPRWPNSNVNTISQMGRGCPYAHHYSELHFKQEDLARESGIRKAMSKGRDKEEEKKQEEKKKQEVNEVWIPASSLKGCEGCGKCNDCKSKKIMRARKEEFDKATKEKNEALLNTERQKQKKKEIDRYYKDYNKKLGLLRRSIILIGFERWGDAFNTLIKAVRRVREDEEREKKLMEMREKKVKEELEVSLNVDCEKLASKPLTLQSLKECGVEEPIQKIKVLLRKLSSEDPSMLSKNSYLNSQILELYAHLDKLMESKRKDLKSIKHKIRTLENEPQNKGRKLKSRTLTKTTEMCEEVKKGGKCKDKSCTYPHTAIELDFVENENKIKNLQNTIKQIVDKLIESKAKVPWRPTKSNDIECILSS